MMKKIFQIALIVAGSLFLLSLASFTTENRFKVTRVYDGDTIRVENPERSTYIMLIGIDAPEISLRSDRKGQPFGEDAKEALSDLVLDRTIQTEGFGRAPYPHKDLISVVYVDGKNINLEMVKRGLAEVTQQDLPPDFNIAPYLEAEKEARDKKLGIWSQGDQYVSPSNWRKVQSLQ